MSDCPFAAHSLQFAGQWHSEGYHSSTAARGALILMLLMGLRGFANFHRWKMQPMVAFF